MSSKDVTLSNGFFDLEQPHLLVHEALTQKQTDYSLVLQPKSTAVQQDTQPQVPQQEQAQQQHQQHQEELADKQQLQQTIIVEHITPSQPMEVDSKQQNFDNDQSSAISIIQDLPKSSGDRQDDELQQQKKKSISKLKQRSADELSTGSKMTTDSDHPKSASAPEASNKSKATSNKSKTTSNGAEPKKISPKTRKASLATIIYRQLMAAGGLGLGVGIDKTVPIPPRKRPPVQKSQAVSTSKTTTVVDKKSSNKASTSTSKAVSSDSSGDPMPEHFGSANGEIATTISGNNPPAMQRVRLDAEQLEFMCSIFIHRISPLCGA
uniref:Uncharacterized protein n=1 Tax=Anopheles culicifacies TaxID=139723 RepID=A0A182MW71_9DIPT